MPRKKPPYPPAFRAEAVRLILSGHKPLSEIAKDLGVTDQTLRNLCASRLACCWPRWSCSGWT